MAFQTTKFTNKQTNERINKSVAADKVGGGRKQIYSSTHNRVRMPSVRDVEGNDKGRSDN